MLIYCPNYGTTIIRINSNGNGSIYFETEESENIESKLLLINNEKIYLTLNSSGSCEVNTTFKKVSNLLYNKFISENRSFAKDQICIVLGVHKFIENISVYWSGNNQEIIDNLNIHLKLRHKMQFFS